MICKDEWIVALLTKRPSHSSDPKKKPKLTFKPKRKKIKYNDGKQNKTKRSIWITWHQCRNFNTYVLMAITPKKWGTSSLNIGCDGDKHRWVATQTLSIKKCVKPKWITDWCSRCSAVQYHIFANSQVYSGSLGRKTYKNIGIHLEGAFFFFFYYLFL